MKPVEFQNAYYVKLGKSGQYAESSISEGKIRIGWREQTPDDINNWREDIIREKIRLAREQEGRPQSKAAISNDLTALKKFVHSTPDDIWITFHDSYLWWCQVAGSGIEEDEISKYRKVAKEWRKCDIEDNPLIISQIPGVLAKTQGFQATICSLGADEVEALRRLLNNQPSEEFRAILKAKADLIKQVGGGLGGLHWKDFETLVDLIFRNAGWRRISLVGETMKYVDMELEEPITGDLYQVQVKSDATLADFKEYAHKFSQGNFRKFYFVVHNSQEKWANAPVYENVELILQERLAEMVVDLGLVNWLLKKIK